ncbi:MAG TPA: DUF4388 domain-containing protein [Pyrinomonadaceae bacterium]|nr:DUF4388 domain-containing protein [Pyrinomonadaceae bacterium]
MQNHRFVVLTGHLSNYPLSDLVGILRHQKKTGRLLIEYPKGPASFFFQEGELVDARMNDLSGLQAVCVALAQPEAAFNFNPLIPATKRSIEPSLHRAVSELFGCWDESALQIETTAAVQPVLAPQPEPLALPAAQLALPPAPPSALRQRPMLFMAAAVLVGVGLSTVIAVTGGFTPNPPAVIAAAPPSAPISSNPPPSVSSPQPVRAPKPRPKTSNTDKTDKKTESTTEPIKVTMQIENGRVMKASIANHKPGRENYEALALRIARQRRYPTTANGGQTVTITVSPED